ncbi:MAG TPA: hypothetical protein PK026_10070 [Bacteroides graminisolvens]|nr:hypothetical protein [Bacteroides graminisolvens]
MKINAKERSYEGNTKNGDTLYYIEINKGKKKRKVILQKDDENYKDGKICKKTSKNIL